MPVMTQKAVGFVSVNGKIRGQVNGIVIGEIHGIVRGEINAIVEMGDMIPFDEVNHTVSAIEAGSGEKSGGPDMEEQNESGGKKKGDKV